MLKKLELEISRASEPSAQPTDPPSSRPPPFRVEAAVKLVPKYSEHDAETFLLSFEKVAELNNFPPDKYATILQAHLTGKTLKVLLRFLLSNVGIILLLKLLCFRHTQLFRKSIVNVFAASIRVTLRLLSLLSVWIRSSLVG